jgi:hypothetical protein
LWDKEGQLGSQLVVHDLLTCFKRALLELTLALQLQGIIPFSGGESYEGHDDCGEEGQSSHFCGL